MARDGTHDELPTPVQDTIAKLSRNPIERIISYRTLRKEMRDGYGRWLLLIKELRVTHEISILEAERMALSNPHRRRWVEKTINTRQKCRKHALAHIRYAGADALIEREGDTLNFRVRR